MGAAADAVATAAWAAPRRPEDPSMGTAAAGAEAMAAAATSPHDLLEPDAGPQQASRGTSSSVNSHHQPLLQQDSAAQKNGTTTSRPAPSVQQDSPPRKRYHVEDPIEFTPKRTPVKDPCHRKAKSKHNPAGEASAGTAVQFATPLSSSHDAQPRGVALHDRAASGQPKSLEAGLPNASPAFKGWLGQAAGRSGRAESLGEEDDPYMTMAKRADLWRCTTQPRVVTPAPVKQANRSEQRGRQVTTGAGAQTRGRTSEQGHRLQQRHPSPQLLRPDDQPFPVSPQPHAQQLWR